MAAERGAVRRSAPIVGASLGAAGAAVAAVAASLCCVGPAVVALLGTGGAIAVARLEPWRPYLLGFAVLTLGLGFLMAYRRGGVCRDGTCSRGATRFVKLSLWLSTLILAIALALPYLIS